MQYASMYVCVCVLLTPPPIGGSYHTAFVCIRSINAIRCILDAIRKHVHMCMCIGGGDARTIQLLSVFVAFYSINAVRCILDAVRCILDAVRCINAHACNYAIVLFE